MFKVTAELVLHSPANANDDVFRFALFDNANELWIFDARTRGRWKIEIVGQALPLARIILFGRRERLPYRIFRRDITIIGCDWIAGIARELECFDFRLFARQNEKKISWDARIRGFEQNFEKREARYASEFFARSNRQKRTAQPLSAIARSASAMARR